MLFYSLLNTITVELAASMSFSFCIMKSFCFIKKVPSCSSQKRWGRRIKWILDFASILVYNFAAVDVTNDDESLLLVTQAGFHLRGPKDKSLFFFSFMNIKNIVNLKQNQYLKIHIRIHLILSTTFFYYLFACTCSSKSK